MLLFLTTGEYTKLGIAGTNCLRWMIETIQRKQFVPADILKSSVFILY